MTCTETLVQFLLPMIIGGLLVAAGILLGRR